MATATSDGSSVIKPDHAAGRKHFIFSQEHEDLRESMRSWVEKELWPHRNEWEDTYWPTEAMKRAGELGYLGLCFPEEYGGQGGDYFYSLVRAECMSYSGSGGTNMGFAVQTDMTLPPIHLLGTEEQKRRYLEPGLKGEKIACLGITEPGAGSDVAGIRTTALRDGDEYVINGQKMYTSSAHVSTHIYLMARTNPNLPKHRGISIFLFPMDTPGITVRPLWTIQNDPPAPVGTTYGHQRTNETFFDDVRIPASSLLGKENEGWRVGAMGLNRDRVGASRYLISVRRDEDIVNFVKSNTFDGFAPAKDPAIRDKIADLWIEAQVCRLMTMRSMSIVNNGGTFTYEGSAEKVWAPEHGVRTTEAISQMLGPYGQLLNGSPHAVNSGVFAHNLMGAFQSGINHGSTQVMRDQVARRGLDMPRK